MKIADIHAHIFPDALAAKATHSIASFYHDDIMDCRPASLSCLLQEHRAAGITCGVVCSSATTPAQVQHINDFIAKTAHENPQYLGFGSVYPGMPGVEDELDRMLSLGLRGIKIHPEFQKLAIDAPEAVDTYRAIAKRGLPVLFHMGDAHSDLSSPERLLHLLRQVPDLRPIAAHFGGWQSWQHAYEHPLPDPVVYDTSSSTALLSADMVLRFLDRYGEDRLLFGTDFPMWKPLDAVNELRALRLGRAAEEKLFYGNFARYFGLQ